MLLLLIWHSVEDYMNAFKELLRVCEKIEKRLKTGQVSMSSTALDIVAALKKHNLFDIANEVSPLLNVAKVPETAAVKIIMVVDKNLLPHIAVSTDPRDASALTLTRLLQAKYAAKMRAALQAEHIVIPDTMEVNWLTF